MRGRVVFWKADFKDGPDKVFNWGLVSPDGFNGGDREERIYFNQRTACYSPVKIGDDVEYELSSRGGKHQGHTATKVEKIYGDD